MSDKEVTNMFEFDLPEFELNGMEDMECVAGETVPAIPDDAPAFSVDLDGSGSPDLSVIDMDGDDMLDGTLIDTNGDGEFDTMLVDSQGTGSFDMAVLDTDHDGEFDAVALDSQGTGFFDVAALDTDHDGEFDTVGLDSNGDHIIDTFDGSFDTDHDGVIDQTVREHDYNQDGMIDSRTVHMDMDGDGVFDTVVKQNDSDHDGVFDTSTTYFDHDADGLKDEIIREQLLDQDGDGTPDTYVFSHDSDGDRSFETVSRVELDPGTDFSLPVLDYGHAGCVAGTYADELRNFNPDHADMDAVSGDPETSMQEWEYQGDTGRCALYSQKFILDELTGQDIDMEDMADFAVQNGWFDEANGTAALNMNKMLDHFGIENDMHFHASVSDIEDCLNAGGKVIVSIDADEIWYGSNENLFTPGSSANHAVQVIGIDHTDPDQPMVILNDSGSPEGCGEMVPMDVFTDAWEAGNCQLITCFGG